MLGRYIKWLRFARQVLRRFCKGGFDPHTAHVQHVSPALCRLVPLITNVGDVWNWLVLCSLEA